MEDFAYRCRENIWVVDTFEIGSFKASGIHKKLTSQAVISTEVFLRTIKFSIIFIILSFIMGGLSIVSSGKTFEILIHKELMQQHLTKMFSMANLVYMITVAFMVICIIVDLIFDTPTKYGIFKEYRDDSPSRITNLGLTIGFGICAALFLNALQFMLNVALLKYMH